MGWRRARCVFMTICGVEEPSVYMQAGRQGTEEWNGSGSDDWIFEKRTHKWIRYPKCALWRSFS